MASLLKRSGSYYLQWCVSGKIRRRSLHTDVLQIAKEQKRQFESSQIRGLDNPLPTRTSIPDILQKYVEHIRTVKTAKSAQTDVYYLREAFGPVCEGLIITSRRVSEAVRKRALQPEAVQDLRCRPVLIEAPEMEAITTAQVSAFLSGHVPPITRPTIAAATIPTSSMKPSAVAISDAHKKSCRACGSKRLHAQYGKFGYFYVCIDCTKNTPIDLTCRKCRKKGRIRKDKLDFYRECEPCGLSELVHKNVPLDSL